MFCVLCCYGLLSMLYVEANAYAVRAAMAACRGVDFHHFDWQIVAEFFFEQFDCHIDDGQTIGMTDAHAVRFDVLLIVLNKFDYLFEGVNST